MPYKDPKKASAAVMRHYYSHKEQYQERNKRVRRRKAEYIKSLKDVPCMDCGIKYPTYVMEFDHREDKFKPITRMTNYGWSTLKAEIAKCDVVCANCHSVRTYKRSVGEMVNAGGLNPLP